ncbi:MAG: respiratory nitrate reductase subunit gamma [Deltaproteobacteria bacterium]|nr:respiratory nitrate reductase subunit gamma [Deltaproteobacteria bacterium]
MAGIVFVVGVTYRYRRTAFTVSSLSSQFLEGDKLFWGSVPFHIGLLAVFFGHLLAFLLPQATLAWNSVPVRLIILEAW